MILIKCAMTEQLMRKSALSAAAFIRRSTALGTSYVQPCRGKKNDSNTNVPESLFHPVPIKPNPDDINVGAELTGSSLKKTDLLKILNIFSNKTEIKELAQQYGIHNYLQGQAFTNFKQYCLGTESLPVDLYVVLSDILQGAGNVSDIFPYFISHAKKIFPHLDCLDDLKKISDLRSPATWYPLARSKNRKIIFHAGPTNSGKTYHALERFITAKSGVYCAPLKLLVAEVFYKCNERGTSCDLLTGEERKHVKGYNNPASHLSCSVEMANLQNNYEVAVIDEIQLMRDLNRGWAWTRALLGIPADEIHLCGEDAAIELVKAICVSTGENVEVRRYKRLTQLKVENRAVETLNNIMPGDCIVCFNKNDIYNVSRSLESKRKEVAVIYGSLPPGTKLAQAAKFNDPNNSCKILVATNAIGMGLNLHIRRIIFYSLIQPTSNEKGEKEMDVISVSAALQIAGRAGRYGTAWETGYVTTFKREDLLTLKNLLSQTPETITQAGLHPTADQIELYAYHLPNSSLSNLMDIFVSLCTVDDSLYFMCHIDDFKFLADMIQHVLLPLRARYVFCCAPINRKSPYVCTMFLKFARQYSKNDAITFNWLCQHIGWPFRMPKTIIDLVHLEGVFDVLDLYLWLSYRFMDLFPDAEIVRDIQKELDALIEAGIVKLTTLLFNSEAGEETDSFELQTQKQNFYRGTGKRDMGKGKLTERLITEGLLTPQMLRELQHEWIMSTKKKK
ncbi:PREDICTED: ATP-dependent RNA helicase SUV3 homolog, mitochondrial [Acromyrmex echinatior]|uniref:ATP-dependent RNA helicase SUV3 homolog, mitochondrial n=1 Tax=Acromyrmex echinatior TaxID=103372 RepID=UPI000580C725|nr:PREDICTED: ATP-dependent RNA helicase SUV3 homolog, mitochondrial [Acromyrmex echinatior]